MKLTLTYRTGGRETTYTVSSETGVENEDLRLDITGKEERTTVRIFPKRPLILLHAAIRYDHVFHRRDQFYVNGYQSWTDTREFDYSEELHNMNGLPRRVKGQYHFPAYGDAWFREYKRGDIHGFTFAYVRKDGWKKADLIGSLNEENAFLIINYHKKDSNITLESDCEGRLVEEEFPLFDFVRYRGEVREVLKKYFSVFGTCGAEPVRGYTSWYNYYQDISEEKMYKSLAQLDSGNFDLFQIDDGYETCVGDWLEIDSAKFPNGLAEIVKTAHDKGLKAGIWLAPFVCETESRLFREHPDWLYTENGSPVFAGCNWSGDVVLDIRKKEVRDYIRKCLLFYREMGFDLFKLDFLYAAALIRDEHYTRAEIMRQAMRGLRDTLPEALILGCGVPLSSAFNLVDYCRVGADVSLSFDDVFFMRFAHRERVSTKQTIQNTIYRNCMDGSVFRCDPDVYLLRDENTKLSKGQRRALTLLNHLCGAVYMTSDDIGAYDEEKRNILEEAQSLANAEVTGIRKKGRFILITYRLQGEERRFLYDRKKGELIYG